MPKSSGSGHVRFADEEVPSMQTDEVMPDETPSLLRQAQREVLEVLLHEPGLYGPVAEKLQVNPIINPTRRLAKLPRCCSTAWHRD